MRSLAARVVALAVLVALATAVLTGGVLARAISATNADQAAATLTTQAENLADLVDAARPARQRGLVARLQAKGVSAQVLAPGALPAAPFVPADVAGSVSSPDPVERQVGARTWLLVARPTADGGAVLVGRPLAAAARLTAAQWRRTVGGAVLGLLGGALAGLLLARGVTRPLARVAAAARRLSAGERDVRVGGGGPREVADVGTALDGLSGALEASERRQREFLLAVSHELRTPLTAVSGYAEALADGALPADQVAHAGAVIRAESARLEQRVQDLLALARLEADDFVLVQAPTDVGALLQAAQTAWQPRAERAGVPLSVQVGLGLPVVTTDGERLRQAVDALVDNALRVLPAGAPLVLAASAQPGGGIRVEVRDGGPGLSPQELAMAFERGRLTERYRGSRPVGSGLGLALVDGLARRLGGRAEASVAAEGGVAFAIVLP